MPTIAPPSAPREGDPAAQPISAPAPIAPAVVPRRSAPAPAGWNEEREAGSIRREHSKGPRACDNENPLGQAEYNITLYAIISTVIAFPIETPRLLLRPFTLADAVELHEIWGDPEIGRAS